MLRLEITDPATMDPAHLRAAIAFLHTFVEAAPKLQRIATGPAALAIAAADNPATGALEPADVFTSVPAATGVSIDIAEMASLAFGAPATPNVPSAALSSAAAAAFSTAPAVPPAISTAPSVPLPPVPSAAATVPTAVPPIPLGSLVPVVDLDAKGLPWDVRIHSSSRAKIADGTWKMKRGTIPDVVARVEAELRGVMSIPAAAPAWPFQTAGDAGLVPNVPDSVVVAVPTPPVPAPASPSSMTFPQLVSKITTAKVAGTMSDDHIRAALASVQCTALPLLAARPDLIPAVAAELDRLMAS